MLQLGGCVPESEGESLSRLTGRCSRRRRMGVVEGPGPRRLRRPRLSARSLGDSMIASFGDNVRIRVTKETEAAGVAGLKGQVYGETTPSVTGVQVVGSPSHDFALNVYFEERREAFWFAPELVEFLDHAVGSEIRLAGVDRRWIRTEDGGWKEESLRERKRPRWKFW